MQKVILKRPRKKSLDRIPTRTSLSLQKNLFIVQAELAGAPKAITPEKVQELEEIINAIEKELPENIPHIFISSAINKNLIELKDMLWNALNKPI